MIVCIVGVYLVFGIKDIVNCTTIIELTKIHPYFCKNYSHCSSASRKNGSPPLWGIPLSYLNLTTSLHKYSINDIYIIILEKLGLNFNA